MTSILSALFQRPRPEDRRSRLAPTLILAVFLLSCTTPTPSTPSAVSSEANSQSGGGGNSQAGPTNCLNGVGFWKNHPAVWKLSSLTLALRGRWEQQSMTRGRAVWPSLESRTAVSTKADPATIVRERDANRFARTLEVVR